MLVIPCNNSKLYSLPLFLSVLSGALLAIFVPVRRSRRWTGSTWRLQSALWSLYLWLSHLALLVPPQLFNWRSPNLDSRGGEENGWFSFSLYTLLLQATAKLFQYIHGHLRHCNTSYLCPFQDQCTPLPQRWAQVPSAKPKQQDGSTISHSDHRVWLYDRVRPMFHGCNPPRQTQWNMCRFMNWKK